MDTIETLIEKYGENSTVVQEAIDERTVFVERVQGKTWEQLTQHAKPWREVMEK